MSKPKQTLGHIWETLRKRNYKQVTLYFSFPNLSMILPLKNTSSLRKWRCWCSPGLWVGPARRAAGVLWGDRVGPEHTFPDESEERGPHQSPAEGVGIKAQRSLGKNREKWEQAQLAIPTSLRTKMPNRGGRAGTVGDGGRAADTQNWIQVLGLHRPDSQLRVRMKMEREQQHRATTALFPCAQNMLNWWEGQRLMISNPSGKMWYGRPSGPRRRHLPRNDHTESCLISLHARPGQNVHRNEHIPGCNIPPRPLIFLSTSRWTRHLGDPLIQFCIHGDISPSPSHLPMYHSMENKAPYINSAPSIPPCQNITFALKISVIFQPWSCFQVVLWE